MKTCLGFFLLIVVVGATLATVVYQWQAQSGIEFKRAVDTEVSDK